MSKILILILSISIFFRLFALQTVPDSLQNDEVANTYGSRFILLNGVDLYGNSFPLLYLDKFGDYPPVLPMYLSGLGTFIFGNNEFGARVLIALTGALIVIPAYFIGLTLFKKKLPAYVLALLFATAPGHIMLSRYNAEAIVALTVYFAALALTLAGNSLNNKKEKIQFVAGSLLFILTYFIYPGYRILIPLTFLGFIVYGLFQKKKISKLLPIGFFVIAALLTVYISTTEWGKGRFNQTSILSDVSGVALKIQALTFNEGSILEARIYNNKIIGFGREFISQYSKYFSLDFLFGESGSPNMYDIPFMGQLLLVTLPFLFASFFWPVQKNNSNADNGKLLIIVYLILISPISAALTVIDVPSVQRALLTPALILIVITYGFAGLLEFKKMKIPILVIFVAGFMAEMIFFSHQYFQNFNYYTSHYRNDGNKQLVQYIGANHHKYNKVVVTSQESWLPSYYLFYNDIYNKELAGTFKQNFRIAEYENVMFPDVECPASKFVTGELKLARGKKHLIVDSINCPRIDSEKHLKKISAIKRLNELEIFTIYESQ